MAYESIPSALDYIFNSVQVLICQYGKRQIFENIQFGGGACNYQFGTSRMTSLLEDMVTRPKREQCLMRHIYAPGFYCTLDNGNILADWSSENSQLITYTKLIKGRILSTYGTVHHSHPRSWRIKGSFIFLLREIVPIVCTATCHFIIGKNVTTWNTITSETLQIASSFST